MRKKFFCILISLTVPLFLYINVWQSYLYTSSYFEVGELVDSQKRIISGNNVLLNRVAELQSPKRAVERVTEDNNLVPLGDDSIIRVEVLDSDR